ncbi:MAG: hypothetical protein K8F91_17925 [Candidatus Obscuribacterales bacterium]|nr:hypothetical protein [Candidatus Obscuribacterales bacterium]
MSNQKKADSYCLIGIGSGGFFGHDRRSAVWLPFGAGLDKRLCLLYNNKCGSILSLVRRLGFKGGQYSISGVFDQE